MGLNTLFAKGILQINHHEPIVIPGQRSESSVVDIMFPQKCAQAIVIQYENKAVLIRNWGAAL